ncbi:MAG: hypothetical protein AAF191_08550 [Verrucomicrobiota bacterium]
MSRQSFMGSAVRVASFLTGGILGFTAWIVLASQSGSRDQGPRQSMTYEAMWHSSSSSGGLLTHGPWVCGNAECRYRVLSGGRPFRSAASQDCSVCRMALGLVDELKSDR